MTELSADTIAQTSSDSTLSLVNFHQIAVNYLDRIINLLPNIFLGLIIFILFYLLYRFLRIVTSRALLRAKITPSVSESLLTLLKYSVLGYGLVLALEPIFPRIISLLAGLGILGIAIGFAAKDTLANLIAGISIFWDKPFEIGDVVTLDNTTGKVDRISLRSTRLITFDNFLVSIPNQNVINNKVINLTRLGKQRIIVSLPVSAQVDIEKIRAIFLNLVNRYQQEKRILSNPSPRLVVTDLKPAPAGPTGDNLPDIPPGIVQLECWVWIEPGNPAAVTPFGLRERMVTALQKEGLI